MKYKFIPFILSFGVCSATFAQFQQNNPGSNHGNKFEQLETIIRDPNMYRSASGAPGPAYWQQKADYVINAEIDDKTQRLTGSETITYTNNSPDPLTYLWLQLDENEHKATSDNKVFDGSKMNTRMSIGQLNGIIGGPNDYGVNILKVTDAAGTPLKYTINQTMMRIDLPKTLMPGGKYSFKINWNYKITDRTTVGGRGGYEYFAEDDNYLYTIAQWFPRMAVYSDFQGWQNKQFTGRGEFALAFGDYKVSITVPADHIIGATGECQNYSSVLTSAQLNRWKQAQSASEPVEVVTLEEAKNAMKSKSTAKKTWIYQANNVRDFAFVSSRRLVWDAMKVDVEGKTPMAMSYYGPEAYGLYRKYSTKVVANTLKVYSKHTITYPYPVAISVEASNGMEYPMICFNYGRTEKDGTYSEATKYGMIGVITHEVGHNFFPMIVNSDERQWSWMDEGLNSFMEYMAEQELGTNFPSRRGPAKNIVPYMSGDQKFLEPIMSNSETIYQFGNNAYGKPATGLNILRETIMGRELFDHAFKVYANRWKFKHPTPEDFFRTMEDASAFDLDWFIRGWFYSTDFVDIGVEEVKQYYVSETATSDLKDVKVRKGRFGLEKGPFVYLVSGQNTELNPNDKKALKIQDVKLLSDYVDQNLSAEEKANLKAPNYFYEVTFNKPGGMLMPILVELTYEDDTKENFKYPAQIWRKNNDTARKVFATQKAVKKIQIDPKLETADIDVTNNTWPKQEEKSKFE